MKGGSIKTEEVEEPYLFPSLHHLPFLPHLIFLYLFFVLNSEHNVMRAFHQNLLFKIYICKYNHKILKVLLAK